MLGITLSIVIPVVLIGYGIWLAARMVRNRKKGTGCAGGCSCCPYAGDCSMQPPKPRSEEHRDA